MFFFIGGVQPKTVRLDETPERCPACGRYQAIPTRIDHYLSLFFIPLFRVKKGRRFLACEACGHVAEPKDFNTGGPSRGDVAGICPACGRPVSPDFQYCPYCGRKL